RVCSIGFGKRGNSWDAGQRGSQGDTSPCIGVRGRSPVKAGAARKKPSRRDGQPACKAGIRHTQPRRCGHINAAQAGLPARIVTKMSLLRGQRKQRPQKKRPEGRLFFLSCRTAAARTLTSQRYLKNQMLLNWLEVFFAPPAFRA